MKRKIDKIIQNTLKKCFETGVLNKTNLPPYVVEIPNNPDHGHFATNLPMLLASSQKKAPRNIAEIIVENIEDNEGVLEKLTIAGPGFINFIIQAQEWYKDLFRIISLRDKFGESNVGSNEKIIVEFVSANPTGPLHVGHGRGAALGDTICRILSFCGYDVAREFYINDAGLQIRMLGDSVYSRWKQISNPDYPFPENGYHGDYILDLAKEIDEESNLSSLEKEAAIELCSQKGQKTMLSAIKEDLSLFRVDFDAWYYESDLFKSGLVDKALTEIRERGELYDKDGAVWINTSAYGDDKDRVIKKQDGQFTYFASDISYHLDKHKRGFSKAVNIWGADHHGYVQRVKSALKADGLDENWLSVLLIQLVKLWEEGQEVKMSKRSGHYITLKELIDEVGVDAIRFVFLTKSHDSTLDFDIDLVKKQSSENPVFYVQYAHARICSIFRKAESEGITLPEDPGGVFERLLLEEEMSLIRFMLGFPTLLEDISVSFEAHKLTYYLTELAARFHRYFNLGSKIPENRIVTEDKSLSHARLYLVDAIRIVIFNGLKLLGINAPEKM